MPQLPPFSIIFYPLPSLLNHLLLFTLSLDIHHRCLGRPTGLFLFGFHEVNLFNNFPQRQTCPAYPILFLFITATMSSIYIYIYKLQRFYLCFPIISIRLNNNSIIYGDIVVPKVISRKIDFIPKYLSQ